MTSSQSQMKIINFILNEEKRFRYKFPLTIDSNVIDSTIRREFNLQNCTYSLIDTSDDAVVDLSSLIYLDSNSNIKIEIKTKHPQILPPILMKAEISNCPAAGTLSFSDNNGKLILSDLSSTTSTSESDSKSDIHYVSNVTTTGLNQWTQIQQKKKRRELRIMCNRKINYFLVKYANIDPIDCKSTCQQILLKGKIELHDLYNILKYLRHQVDLSTIQLNKENIADIVVQVHNEHFLTFS